MEESMRKRLEAVKTRCEEIDRDLGDPAIMNNVGLITELSKERSSLSEAYEGYLEYLKAESDLKDADDIINSGDAELAEMMKLEKKSLLEKMEKIEVDLHGKLLPADPNDKKNIIVEIRGAVGGDEANIFAGDLLRMYTRYAENQGWKVQYIDGEEGSAGGYSYVSFMVKGKNVYSKLKFESGAHRVQRVPKTEASGRIHTSTATVLVMPEAEEVDVKINPADLKIYLSFSGCWWTKRQQDRIRCPCHPHPNRNRCQLPDRKGSAPEQGNLYEDDPCEGSRFLSVPAGRRPRF